MAMRKTILYYFCVAQLLFSCLAEQDNPLAGTCKDKIKNQNEEGVDCGGVCGACQQDPDQNPDPDTDPKPAPVVAPCQGVLRDNYVTLNGIDSWLHEEVIDNEYFFYSQSADYYEIFIQFKDYSNLWIGLGGTLPKSDKVYSIVDIFSISPGKASIQYTNAYFYDAVDGKVYLTFENGKPVVEICPMTFSGNGPKVTFSGRIMCLN